MYTLCVELREITRPARFFETVLGRRIIKVELVEHEFRVRLNERRLRERTQ